ncbi:hypothetical protein AnigIFM63326_010321 [Aspergillus niger]|nr:hypothetical protein AnigIFM63326_010321 [Aspergillus niger]
MTSRPTLNPAAREHHHFSVKEKHNYQSFKFKQYADFAQTILVAATIASTITLSKVYEAPSNSTLGESQVILAWASSLFITAIAASIILVASAKLEIAFQMLQVQSLVISLIVLVAFYLLMAAPSFRQQYTGPFLLGTVAKMGWIGGEYIGEERV